MSDFVSEELIEINIEGRKFKFKELTGEEMDRILNNSMRISPEGEITFDLLKQNNAYLGCVMEAPYTKTIFKKDEDGNVMLDENGKEIEIEVNIFEPLNKEERINLLNKIKNSIRRKLLNEIKNYHNELGDVEKK